MEDEIVWHIQFDAAMEFGAYKVTDEGYLLVSGTAAAEGTMTYENAADGSKVVDYVSGEVLEASAHLLKNTPITLEHPPGLLDSKSVRAYQVGEVLDSTYNPGTRANDVEIIVRDFDSVQSVLSREVTGLSPGYRVRREKATDSAHGADRIQVERIYNHLALTRKPRRGETTSVRLDSAGNAIFEEPEPENRMDPEETDETKDSAVAEPTSNDVLLGAFVALKNEFAALREALTPAEEPEVEVESDSADDFLVRVAEYNRTCAAASRLGVEFDSATDSTEAIQRKIVTDKFGASAETATPEYLRGMMAVLDSAPSAEPMEDVADAFGFNRPAGRKPADKVEIIDPTRLEMNRGRAKTGELTNG